MWQFNGQERTAASVASYPGLWVPVRPQKIHYRKCCVFFARAGEGLGTKLLHLTNRASLLHCSRLQKAVVGKVILCKRATECQGRLRCGGIEWNDRTGLRLYTLSIGPLGVGPVRSAFYHVPFSTPFQFSHPVCLPHPDSLEAPAYLLYQHHACSQNRSR